MKFLKFVCLSIFLSISYVNAEEKNESMDEPEKLEVLKVELVCPKGSRLAGDTVPDWANGDYEVSNYCNSNGENLDEQR